jgi:hypothetical protein
MDDRGRHAGDGPRSGSIRLDRAPGTRYETAPAVDSSSPAAGPSSPAAGPAGDIARAVAAAGAAVAAGALVMFALGLVDLGAGLIAAAAGVGWAVALALIWGAGASVLPARRARMTLAAGLGAAAIVLGFLLDWGWARSEGGVLDPAAYLDARYGLLAWAIIGAGAAAAAWRARQSDPSASPASNDHGRRVR